MKNFYTRSCVAYDKPTHTTRATTRLDLDGKWVDTRVITRTPANVALLNSGQSTRDETELQEARLLSNHRFGFVSVDYKNRRLRVKYERNVPVEIKLTERNQGVVHTLRDLTPMLLKAKDPVEFTDALLDNMQILTAKL